MPADEAETNPQLDDALQHRDDYRVFAEVDAAPSRRVPTARIGMEADEESDQSLILVLHCVHKRRPTHNVLPVDSRVCED